MMEHHNYALFIGRLILAMTDAAPNPKCFHLHFHVANEQRSHGLPAFQRWADKYLWRDGESLLIRAGDLFLRNLAAGAYLLRNK